MRVIGLTGGIGSGKSAAAGILAELGAHSIDADKIGHEIYRPGTPGWSKVVAEFGTEIVAADGTIDRRKLGQRVFSDSAELRKLNALVHPLIAQEIRRRIEMLRSRRDLPGIVVEAAVLLEAGWDDLVDEVWVVVASPTLVIDRVVRDRGLPADDVARRIASQLGDQERIAKADRVISNSGSLEDLRVELERAWSKHILS